MPEDQIDMGVNEMADTALRFFFLTYGVESKPRFETDAEFAQTLNSAAMQSFGIFAIACTEDDLEFQKLAQQMVGNPKHECDEVAALRICVLDNFTPEAFKEIEGIVHRLNWFRRAYIDARGGSLPHCSSLQ